MIVCQGGPMTDGRKARIWVLWKQGNPMITIARDIGKPPATVYSYLLYHGGIKPRPRIRRPGCLSQAERETISRGLARGQSCRYIAAALGRAPSTIPREVARNGGREHNRACQAEKACLERSKRLMPCLLSTNSALKAIVVRLLERDWSPEQIAGWLKLHSADNASMCVSQET